MEDFRSARKFTVQQAQKVYRHVGLIQSHGASHTVETDSDLEALIRSLRERSFQQRHRVRAVPGFRKLRAALRDRRVTSRCGLLGDLGLGTSSDQCKKKTGKNCF